MGEILKSLHIPFFKAVFYALCSLNVFFARKEGVKHKKPSTIKIGGVIKVYGSKILCLISSLVLFGKLFKVWFKCSDNRGRKDNPK